MGLMQVINLAGEYLVLSIKYLVLIGLIYWIFFRKIVSKYIKFNTRRALVFCLLFSYILIVIGATIFYRANLYEHANLHIFSSYIEAWNNFSKAYWRNIILNILMFVPLGILLPIYNSHFKKFYWTFLLGFLFTLGIELTQYFTKRGIFELDDLFNNFLGLIIGYCLISLVFLIFDRNKIKARAFKIALCILPILSVVIIAYIGVDFYKNQKIGNLSINYNYIYDMSKVELSSEVKFNSSSEDKHIYVVDEYSEEDAVEFATTFFNNIGKTIEKSYTEVDDDKLTFYSADRDFILYCGLKNSTYSFTDLNNAYYNEDMHGAYSEEYIRNILKDYNVNLSEVCKFERVYFKGEIDYINSKRNAIQINENYSDEYKFSVSDLKKDGELLNGCIYVSNTDKMLTVDNNIIKYEPREKYEIISEQEAYDEIKQGKFNAYEMYNIKSIVVKSIELSYRLDSKGFYQPVYQFECIIDGQGRPIYIPAIKDVLP